MVTRSVNSSSYPQRHLLQDGAGRGNIGMSLLRIHDPEPVYQV